MEKENLEEHVTLSRSVSVCCVQGICVVDAH